MPALRRHRLAAAVLGLTLALSCCSVGGSTEPSATNPVPPVPPSGAPTVPPGAGLSSVPPTGGTTEAPDTPSASPSESPSASPTDLADSVTFTSPSGNLACVMTADTARCDVGSYTFEPPAKPPSCTLDWGSSVAVGSSGPGTFLCVGDSAFGAHEVLAYGSTISVVPFTCRSARGGMTCINGDNGHGFALARASYTLF